MDTATQAPWELEWKDYYQILDVPPDATLEAIKEAYRYLAFAFHPDRFPEGHEARRRAEEDFKRINEAYEVLSDPGERERYDREYRLCGDGAAKGPDTRPARLTLDPAEITVTGVTPGQTVEVSFTVDVGSGAADADQLRIQPDQPWVSILRVGAESIAPPDMFPLRVTAELDTYALVPGQTYQSDLYVMVGGRAAGLTLVLSVAAAGSTAAMDYSVWDAGTASSMKTHPVWFFGWLPQSWQIGLALLGGIVAPGFVSAWSIGALVRPADFALVRFVDAFAALVPFLQGLPMTPAIWVPVGSTAMFALGVYSIFATRLLSRLTSCGWPTVLAADVVELSGFVAGAGIAAVLGWFLLVGALVVLAIVVGVILGLLMVAAIIVLTFAIIAAAVNS